MTPSEDPTGERSFLHDLSNLVAVVQGNLHLLSVKAKKNPDAFKTEDVMKRVEPALASMTKLVELLNSRREQVRSSMSPADKVAS